MIDKQSFSTKPGILGPHRQRNRTLAAYKRNLIFQIFFQLKGLKSSLQTSGGGRVLALLLKMVPLRKAQTVHGAYLLGTMAGGRWLRAAPLKPSPWTEQGHVIWTKLDHSHLIWPCHAGSSPPTSAYRGNTACVSCPQRNRKGIKTQRGESFGVSWEFGQKLCARIFFFYNTGN